MRRKRNLEARLRLPRRRRANVPRAVHLHRCSQVRGEMLRFVHRAPAAMLHRFHHRLRENRVRIAPQRLDDLRGPLQCFANGPENRAQSQRLRAPAGPPHHLPQGSIRLENCW